MAPIGFDSSSYGIERLSDGTFRFPGFCDVHVHFREPGFSYKETILTGSRSAARGGYTAVCAMPNLDPVPDSEEHILIEREIIARDAVIAVYPYASITKGENGEELVDFMALRDLAIAFSDDGRGVQSDELMREAMERAAAAGVLIVAHCEVNRLNRGGSIHDGSYARRNGYTGIPSESEWKEVERDVKLSEETGCAYHICHVSCKESVEIIRDAKKRGVNVTAETAPHYLLLTDEDLRDSGNFKMSPPIRSAEDRIALIEGLEDGTIDMIITDHAPHSAEEKSKGLEGSANGIVGLDCAFPVLYTGLVKRGIISLGKLMDLMVFAPRERFGIELGEEDYTVWDLDSEYEIDPEEFASKGRATPFAGMKVYGRCLRTVYRGRTVYDAAK